jgi:uncharacterized protein YybS (DUF2232 family)
MARGKLSPIEIAEGALLADVAVIFHVVWMYVPVVGVFFRLLIPIVFTILCLRRGLYAGLIGLAAAFFLAAVVTGPNLVTLLYLLLEGIGGLYLGITMGRRVPHLLIIALGAFGLSAALYSLVFVLAFIIGTPTQTIIATMRHDYSQALAAVDVVAARAGATRLWRDQVVPAITPWVALGFTFWWALLYLYSLAVALPVMVIMYTLTNSFVRVLGFTVRPFPGGWLQRRLRMRRRQLVRLQRRLRRMRRNPWARRWATRTAPAMPAPEETVV